MATLQANDLADIVASTLQDLGRLKIQQIAQTLANFEVFPKWFKKDKVVVDDGYGIKRNLMTRLSGAAAHVGLTDVDNVNITDLIENLEVPWRHLQTSYAVIYQETLMNRGPSKIVDMIKVRRQAAMLDLIEEMETKAWGTGVLTGNKTDPYGVRYWVVKNVASGPTSDGIGFYGGSADGGSSIAGLSYTDAPNFKNRTGKYVAVSKADAIKKMRDMHHYCRFKSPVDLADYRSGKGEQYRVYANRATVSSFEDVGESQNENLGRDIASIDGMSLAFRGHPIRTIDKLDGDSDNPIYFIDHSTFYPVVLKGNWMRESRNTAPNQHNIEQMFVDCSYNYLCVDRRRNGVLSTAAANL